jgi:hypothetical protein
MRIRPTTVAMGEIADTSVCYVPQDPTNLLRADPARRDAVKFVSETVTLTGHLYRPPGAAANERTPGVVTCFLTADNASPSRTSPPGRILTAVVLTPTPNMRLSASGRSKRRGVRPGAVRTSTACSTDAACPLFRQGGESSGL